MVRCPIELDDSPLPTPLPGTPLKRRKRKWHYSTQWCKDSQIVFQQLHGGLGGGGGSRMDAGVLRVCINEDQPVGPHEVDGMVNMHSAPWLLWKHPGMVGRLGWLVLVLCTGSTSMGEVHYVSIYSWPVDCSTCQLFHLLHPKVSQVKKLQHLGSQAGVNNHSRSIQKAPMG